MDQDANLTKWCVCCGMFMISEQEEIAKQELCDLCYKEIHDG